MRESKKNKVLETVSYCSPKRYAQYKTRGTCYDVNELRLLARAYNQALKQSTGPFGKRLIPKQKHEIDLEYASSFQDPEKEIAYLKKNLSARIPVPEHVWGDLLIDPSKHGGVHALVQAALRPRLPNAWLENSHQWLSTVDIDNVMTQYEAGYPDFKFLGVFPIDFDFRPDGKRGGCIANEMCLLSVKSLLARNKRHAGVILNLDEHDKSGSHWVALYMCFDVHCANFGVHYFDSVANATPPEVTRFMGRIAAQMEDLLHVEVPQTSNDVQLQFQNTECGIFAMYFLACCVSEQVSIPDVWKAMANDDTIHVLRKVFYRPPVTVFERT
jgi:Ulp1 protease family, C-terminal catalytic domain